MNLSITQPYEFRNDSSETIPPYGLILCHEIVKRKSDNALFLKAEKPVAADLNHLYRNGMIEVAPDGFGACYIGDIIEVAYDPADGTPKVGEPWGIKPGEADSFKLRRGYGGWEVLYAPSDPQIERVIVRRMNPHLLQGLLAGTLDSPTDGWTDATVQDVTLYIPNRSDGSGSPIDYEEDEITIKDVVNRDQSLSGTNGAYVKIEWLNGEWSPYWVGCP